MINYELFTIVERNKFYELTLLPAFLHQLTQISINERKNEFFLLKLNVHAGV